MQYIDVVRLSDAHHWQFMIPKDAWDLLDVAYIDADEVWYQTRKGVYRQKLEALGPGDPAP